MPSNKVKRVKAWAILLNGEYLTYDANGYSSAAAIYFKEKDLIHRKWPMCSEDTVTEVEITYQLPPKIKSKKK